MCFPVTIEVKSDFTEEVLTVLDMATKTVEDCKAVIEECRQDIEENKSNTLTLQSMVVDLLEKNQTLTATVNRLVDVHGVKEDDRNWRMITTATIAKRMWRQTLTPGQLHTLGIFLGNHFRKAYPGVELPKLDQDDDKPVNLYTELQYQEEMAAAAMKWSTEA